MRTGGRGTRGAAVVLAVMLATAVPMAAVASDVRVPTPGPPSGTGQAGPVTPTATAGTPAAEGSGTGPGHPEPVSEAQRVAAIAEPAMVIIEVRWEGEVRDRFTGELLDTEPVSGTTFCTGVGVGNDGYLLATGACLDQSAVHEDAFGQVVARRIADGSTAPEDADALLAELVVTARIGEAAEVSQRTVLVRRAVTEDEPMPAIVVTVDPEHPDVALLQISRPNQPILPVADGVEEGEEVITLECEPIEDSGVIGIATPAPTGGPEPDWLQPRVRLGTVTDAEPYVLVTPADELPQALPGGVVLNRDAEIVGLVDTTLPTGDVLLGGSVIRDVLERAEIDTELGLVDRDYRAGLEAYYDGRYTESIERFDSVLAIIPSHRQAHDFRAEAQSLREVQGGGPEPVEDVSDQVRRWTNGRSQALVAVGVLIAILFFVFHRRRSPHPVAAPAAHQEPEPVGEQEPQEPSPKS